MTRKARYDVDFEMGTLRVRASGPETARAKALHKVGKDGIHWMVNGERELKVGGAALEVKPCTPPKGAQRD